MEGGGLDGGAGRSLVPWGSLAARAALVALGLQCSEALPEARPTLPVVRARLLTALALVQVSWCGMGQGVPRSVCFFVGVAMS